MQSVFFHTFGCRTNQYDSESIRERLMRSGYVLAQDWKQADTCIINSCTVTAEADRKCRQFVRKVLRENSAARIIVTGCYATRAPKDLSKISARIEVFSNHQKKNIAEIVSGCNIAPQHTNLISSFSRHTRAFVKVQDGCDATCTYCIIPSVRPKMESRSIAEISAEIQNLVQSGYKEIVLTGIRLGSYGLLSSGGRVGKVHGNLADLLRHLITLDGQFRIRLSSLEITEVTDEILELAKNSDKICPHFHLPLQSGDDSILKRMGRWYNLTQYKNILKDIHATLPDVGLTTDVIVGFPGETAEQFQNTYDFLKEHFNGLHVFPFSTRPTTPAEKLPEHCSKKTIESRMQRLLSLDQELRRDFQNRYAGQSRLVLAESGGGFTDNGIRIDGDLGFEEGVMQNCVVPKSGL